MVTINNIQPVTDGTKIEHSVTFEGTNHSVYGDFIATKDEMDNAFKDVSGGDVFSGVKRLVLNRLETEAHNTLSKLTK